MTDNFSESTSGEQEAITGEDDRRKAQRTTALFRPALVESSDLRTFCLVRNISSTGLMTSLHAAVEEGQEINVRFDERNMLKGTVAWHENDRVGIEFSHPIDVADLFVRLSGTGSKSTRYRSPRLEIEADATFIAHGTTHALKVQDISQKGIKAATETIREGEEGTIVLPGLQPRKAVARWAKDGSTGFLFIDPIGFTELGQWVLAHNDR